MTGLQISFGDDDEGEDFNPENEALAKAVALHLDYSQRFGAVAGERDQVSVVREQLRADEAFWELSEHVLEMVGNAQDWVSAIFRVEAKRAVRKYAGRMEEIRLEREARIAAEKAAEQEELASMPNFGMF